ncbi:hypothetical protein EW146_g663 [Bondarzewia mesenterica]|uniref:HTH APSES-type domain-containing protein n=1 Tax=Bondarzewia mesenterica TaxID=1095465 RepID=A0A4S4M8D7_9AGAM|nr:hypothetical protein EW146_g663 [Bondarzewia mesenterica]
MPSHTQFVAPLTGAPRPPLPLQHMNPHVKSLNPASIPTVKYQEIIRDGQSTVVARMKVQTPNGHAFILRRLDTGAVSLTTMFRAAFPTASEEAEKQESTWVKANYDVSGSNRSGKARFAGTWVSPSVALAIADAYSLSPIMLPLTEAMPDPTIEYRRSSRAQEQTPNKSDKSTPTKQMPAPTSMSAPNPAKRRREASPAPKAVPTTPAKNVATPAKNTATPAKNVATPVRNVATPAKSAATPARIAANPAKIVANSAKIVTTATATTTQAATITTPALRRSTRTASPAPAPVPKTIIASKSLRSPLQTSHQPEPPTPGGSDETAVDDDIPDVPGPDASQDIAEQKEMIEAFKAQREANKQQQQEAEPEVVEDSSAKRAREEEGERALQFNFKEPETQERAIATNRRIRMIEMGPERKSFAWGVVAFAAAVGAMTYIPWF